MTAVTGTALDTRQSTILVILGVVLWFLAALLVRAAAPLGALHGWGAAAFYALLVPATLPFVLVLPKLAGLDRAQTAIGVLVMTATAALCDGIALTWFAGLYDGDTGGAGAVILWGVGVGLFLALAVSRRAARA